MNKLFTKVASICLGLAMAVGVGVAVSRLTKSSISLSADSSTYTFTSAQWADSTNSWDSLTAGGQLTSGRGVQVTTNNNGGSARTKNSIPNVSSVVFTYSTNANKGTGDITVTIGSNDSTTLDVTKTGGTTDRTLTFDYAEAQTGKVTFAVNCTQNSIYVKSVQLVYSSTTYVVDKLLLNSSESFSSLTIDGNNAVTSKTATLTYQVTYTGTAGEGKVNTSVKDSENQSTNDLMVSDNNSGTLSLTGKKNGVYTLTVSTKDKNSSSVVVSKNVTVTVQNLLTPSYPTKQTSTTGLSIGDKVYFVNETNNKAAGALDGSYMTAVDVTLDGDGHMEDSGTALEFVLGRNSSYYTFRYTTGLLGIGATKNMVTLNGTQTTTFTLVFDDGNAAVASSPDSTNKLQYNSRFSNYTSAQGPIQLYVVHASDQEVATEFENTYLVMGSTEENQCNTYYANAKSTYATLTDGQISKLSAAALQRLHNWAAAKGDIFDVDEKVFKAKYVPFVNETNSSSLNIVIIAVGITGLISVSGFFFLMKRKEHR